MNYREDRSITEPFKRQYLQGIENLIGKLEQEATQQRAGLRREILQDPERYRKDFFAMLGWPLTQPRDKTAPLVKTELLCEEGDMTIRRMQIEILDGIWMSGLLLRHKDGEKRPFVLTQHGALGTPERITGIFEGTTANYNHMPERVWKAGANVFAPQLLIWSPEIYGVEFDRAVLDAKLKKVGSSITAVEIYGLMRILDYFETQDWVGNIGMVGLSYGGFYTLFTTAADTRIRAAISCSFFCEGNHHLFPDWGFWNMNQCWGEAEIACLVHPRLLMLEMGDQDALFDWRKSRAEYERILEACGDDRDWVEYKTFEGTHEFYQKDDHINKLIDCLAEKA